MKNKNSLNIMKFRQKNSLKSIAEKIEIKPIIIPRIFDRDDSTISHVKRVGGQVLQCYSLHSVNIEAGGHDIFYYLVSDIYSIAYEEDNSKHDIPRFDISVVSTRKERSLEEAYASKKTAKFVSADLYKEITYTTKTLPVESITPKPGSLISFDLTDNIRYTYLNVGRDYYASSGSKFITSSLEEFPFLVKTVSENTKSEVTSFEVKFSK